MNSINLNDYILTDETNANKGCIWLHKLPNDSSLFDIINKLHEKYNNETFVITQNINITNENINKEINFSNCIFQENINLSGCSFNKNSVFSYIKNIQGEVIANAAIFQKEVNFFKANFKESVNFSGTKFGTATEIDNNSKVWVYFREVKFKENVRFHYCSFYNNVTFENTSFNKLVDFYYAIFFRPQQFHLTDFFDRAIFSNTIFNQEIQFIYCRTNSNSHIGFESTIFKRGLDISRSNFNCNLNFWNTTIEEEGEEYIFKNINDIKYKNDFEAHDEAPPIYKQLRETYRIIKDNFYSQNNKIEGLKFYEKEMNVYLEEKRAEDKNPIKKTILFEKILYPIAKLSVIREKYNRIYDITFIASNLIMYMLFVYKQSYTYFWILFLEAFIYVTSLLYQKKKDIKNTIKQNNYISLIVLFTSMFLLFVPIYNVVPKKNTNSDYICIFIEWITSLLTIYYILPYLFPLIAIFLMVLFIRREKLLLWFNKNSNEFGGNWVAGINFTIFVVLITYSLILLPISCNLKFSLTSEGVSNFLKGLVDILNLTDWNEMTIFGEKLTNWQYIFLFIGRIFVAYGVYQTIQAFRKFGKS